MDVVYTLCLSIRRLQSAFFMNKDYGAIFAMKIVPSLISTLFLLLPWIHDAQAATYQFQGSITSASTGCNICDPIPGGMDQFSVAAGDTFSGRLGWNYDPTAAVIVGPGIVEANGWFSSVIDFDGLRFSSIQSGYFFLRDGQFYFEDENPAYSLADGLYTGLPDALRIFFKSATYSPAAGLPASLDLVDYDSVTVELSPLLDYSWNIAGTMTSLSSVPLPSSIGLLASGILGLTGFVTMRSRENRRGRTQPRKW